MSWKDSTGSLLAVLTIVGTLCAAIAALGRAVWRVAGQVSKLADVADLVAETEKKLTNHENRIMTIEAEERRREDSIIALKNTILDLRAVVERVDRNRTEQEMTIHNTLNAFSDTLNEVRENVGVIRGRCSAFHQGNEAK